MSAVASETYTSTSAPIQHAAIRAFQDDPELELYLKTSRIVLKALGLHLAERLRSTGASVLSPLGAFYLFPDFTPLQDRLRARGITTGQALCKRLLEEAGVAILPGSAFGRPEAELTARISYVNFDGASALAGVAALPDGELPDEPFLRRYCGEALEAVDLICAWVAS
jgi:aspartate aminotransferase